MRKGDVIAGAHMSQLSKKKQQQNRKRTIGQPVARSVQWVGS